MPGRPAMTMNTFGLGKAIYIGTMSHQHFYYDLITWLRQMCNLHPLLKVPDTVEVSMRQKEDTKIFFLLNHQNSPVRIQFYKPMHDFLTGSTFSRQLRPAAARRAGAGRASRAEGLTLFRSRWLASGSVRNQL